MKLSKAVILYIIGIVATGSYSAEGTPTWSSETTASDDRTESPRWLSRGSTITADAGKENTPPAWLNRQRAGKRGAFNRSTSPVEERTIQFNNNCTESASQIPVGWLGLPQRSAPDSPQPTGGAAPSCGLPWPEYKTPPQSPVPNPHLVNQGGVITPPRRSLLFSSANSVTSGEGRTHRPTTPSPIRGERTSDEVPSTPTRPTNRQLFDSPISNPRYPTPPNTPENVPGFQTPARPINPNAFNRTNENLYVTGTYESLRAALIRSGIDFSDTLSQTLPNHFCLAKAIELIKTLKEFLANVEIAPLSRKFPTIKQPEFPRRLPSQIWNMIHEFDDQRGIAQVLREKKQLAREQRWPTRISAALNILSHHLAEIRNDSFEEKVSEAPVKDLLLQILQALFEDQTPTAIGLIFPEVLPDFNLALPNRFPPLPGVQVIPEAVQAEEEVITYAEANPDVAETDAAGSNGPLPNTETTGQPSSLETGTAKTL